MVQKLKPAAIVPKSKIVMRAAVCGRCRWIVASPSVQALINEGWATAQQGQAAGFLCKTCAQENTQFLVALPQVEQMFKQFAVAPENPHPCVGMTPPQETSRPPENEAVVLKADLQ